MRARTESAEVRRSWRLMLLFAAVGGGCGSGGGSGAGGPLAAQDAGRVADAAVLPPAPGAVRIVGDAASNPDATPDVEVLPPAPDAAVAPPDAAVAPPFAHCSAWGPPPVAEPGLTVDRTGVSVSCPGFALFVSAAPDGVAYERLDAGRAPRVAPPTLTHPKLDDPALWHATPTELTACLAAGTLTVSRVDCALALRAPDGTLLYATHPAEDTARDEAGMGPDEGAQVHVTHTEAQVPPDAAVYGCGQHTGPLNRAGTRFTDWNTDAFDPGHDGWAPDADPLYTSLPFCTLLVAGASLGVFVDETRRTTFDLGATTPGTWKVESHGTPTVWLLPGTSLAEPASAYRGLTGAATLPPRWAFGFQQSRWGYGSADTVRQIAQSFHEFDLPLDAIWLDIQHLDGFRTFTFDPVAFANPVALMGDLRAAGVRTVAIADPGLKVDVPWPVYGEAHAQGLFLTNPDGTDFVGGVWAGASSFLDFTLPGARAFWAAHVAELRGLGVAGVWLDVNEPTTFPEGGAGLTVPNQTRVRGPEPDLRTMADFHNLYGEYEAQATFDGLRAPENQRPLIVSRAGYAGIQRFAGLWTGDTPSTWDALRQTLPMLLDLGVSGVPYVGSDVGGYSGGATPELYARWLQLGVLSPFFRAHVTSGVSGQEPWMFGIEVTDVSRAWLRERMRLVPYFEALAVEASLTGAPPLRPLAWEFPGEQSLRNVDDEAMLGPSVLAAPVLTEGESVRHVVLPPGRWVESVSGAVIDARAGSAAHDQTVTRAALPLYLREGALLLRASESANHTDALPDARRLDVVPGAIPTRLRTLSRPDTPLSDDQTLMFTQVWDGATLTVGLNAGPNATLPALDVAIRLLHNTPVGARLNGEPLPPETLTVDMNDRTAHVFLQAGTAGTLAVDLTGPALDNNDQVDVELTVEVPPGTPSDPPVSVAGDFNSWAQQPLDWSVPGVQAHGFVRVPRGQWFAYKFTRGGWETVEKWPDCAEASNRYAQGAAHPSRTEQVFGWRDFCPGGG